MHNLLVSLTVILGAVTADDAAIVPGTQLAFRGGVAKILDDRSVGELSKTFDLTILVAESGESGRRLYWLVEEQSQGVWPWIERFGQIDLDANGQPGGVPGPSVLYDYGTGKSVVPLLPPFFQTDQPLSEGATWEANDLSHEVTGQKQTEGHETWQIEVRNRIGPKRTLWVDQQSSLIVSYHERVFMNMGTEYQLQTRFVRQEQLSAEKLAAAQAGFVSLLALRGKLNRVPRSEDEDWTPEQRAELKAALPELENTIREGGLAKLVRAAARDLKLQTGRADAISELEAEYVGREIADFQIKGLSGKGLTQKDLQGQVTVLHFWEYRDEPLEEPYGQVGYLEFLQGRHKDDGTRIYGVAVDGRLENDETRGAAMASVRKLRSFMNLTYPILLDTEQLLTEFGDPRTLGAELPLFVVIGRDGKIRHYHVGFHEVDQQAGLKELEAAVNEALQAN